MSGFKDERMQGQKESPEYSVLFQNTSARENA